MNTERCRGVVTDFNLGGRPGIILMSDGREVKLRYSAILGQGIRKLVKGAVVTFQLEETCRGLNAVYVQADEHGTNSRGQTP